MALDIDIAAMNKTTVQRHLRTLKVLSLTLDLTSSSVAPLRTC